MKEGNTGSLISVFNNQKLSSFLQLYLNLILVEVKSCGTRLSNLDQELLSRLTDLQTGVSTKLAVPTVQAFPLLMRLTKTWQGLQEEMVVLSHLNSLLKALYSHTRY